MTDADADLHRWLDLGADLPPEELAALAARLRDDPAVRARLAALAAVDADAARILLPPRGQTAARVLEAVRIAEDPRFVSRTLRRLPRRRPRRHPLPAWRLPLALAAALLLATGLWWRWMAPAAAPPSAACVLVAGGGTLDGRRLAAGAAVPAGTAFAAAASGATLRYADGTTFAIAGGARLRLPADDGGPRAHLDEGRLEAEVRPQAPERPLVLTTPAARIEVVGTRFALRHERGTTRIDLAQGAVRFTRLADRVTTLLAPGEHALAGPGRPAPAAPMLTADVDRPDHGLYVAGEPVRLSCAVSGPRPDDLRLELRVVDERDAVVRLDELPVPAGGDAWRGEAALSGDRLGFYRVHLRLSDGTALPARDTRPAGFLTYAVLPDPATRPEAPMDRARFGLFANTRVPLGAWLGARWRKRGTAGWGAPQPDGDPLAAAPAEAPGWTVYPWIITLGVAQRAWWDEVYRPGTTAAGFGALTPEGERRFRAYCLDLGRTVAAAHPDLPYRLYDAPVTHWRFAGSPRELARIYELAHGALHEADPRAVLLGPGLFEWPRDHRFDDYERLRAAGLFRWVDAAALHTYGGWDDPPEARGEPATVAAFRRWMRERIGRELPLYATGGGYASDGTSAGELSAARRQVRRNLILLGEGFRFSITNYAADFRNDDGSGNREGLFYKLEPDTGWNPARIAPKPLAPAYAAMTRLIDGRRSAGAVPGLDAALRGYVFAGERDEIVALWRWEGPARSVELPAGDGPLALYDWMGNELPAPAPAGRIRLEPGFEPLYLRRPLSQPREESP